MPEAAPRLSHVGLYVRDVPKMIDFYTKVLGFVVSDGAEDGRITFLSRNPSGGPGHGALAGQRVKGFQQIEVDGTDIHAENA